MGKIPQRYVIRTAKQLAVLACAARQEIVDVLAEMGTVSVAEIAATLGRPADAFYFHLRALESSGLVKQAGYRIRGGRKEALYRTVARELALHYEPRSEANRRAVTTLVSAMLRLGIRDFGRAFQRGIVVSGPNREIWAARKTGRVSRTQMAGVNRSIQRLLRAVSKPNARGRLYGITVILTPLDHRSRERQQSVKLPEAEIK
jgi:predicted ArsR family transcriptional regulator